MTVAERQLSPGRELLLDKARALVPLLRQNAGEADRLGRLPDVVAEALYDEGFLGLHVPRSLGGPEADFRTAFQVYAELGRGCGSSAWVAMILSGGSLLASLLDAPGRQDLWGADPRPAVCSQVTTVGTARQAEGGLVFSGQWRPTSGAHEAEWAMVTVSTTEHPSGPEDISLAVVPINAGLVESTWNVTGLRATGSDTIVFDDVFVPDHRMLSYSAMISGGYGNAHPDEPLCGASVIAALTVTVVAPLLGMSEAALEYTLERLRPDTSTTSLKKQRSEDSSSVRFSVADAASLIDTARLHAYRALADVEQGISKRSQLDPLTQSRIHMDAGTAAKSLRKAVRILLSALGGSSFSATSPVQRIWRDLEIAATHINVSPDGAREDYGKALFS